MATESKSSDISRENSFDYSTLGNEYGVSLKFNLHASDFENKIIENDLITESLSGTKWKFHFHDLYQKSKPIFHNNQWCWNFEHAFLTPVTHSDDLKQLTLSDNYTYAILINWRDIVINDDNKNKNKSQTANNAQWLNVNNHSIQQSITKSHKKIHHWRIPLRARIINQKINKNNTNSNNSQTHSQFVDWITLKSSTTSRTSSIGLRTNYYNETYHSTPSRNNISSSSSTTPTIVNKDIISRKATFIGCDYKLDNSLLYSDWQLIVITGRKHAYDGPDSAFWIGTINKSIRKIGGIRASVPFSCLYSIGSDANSKETKYCCGKISKVMIFDGVLSKPDIQKLYINIFNINQHNIKSLVSKSQKWYSLYSKEKRKRHQRHHSKSNASQNKKSIHNNKDKDKEHKNDDNKKDIKDKDKTKFEFKQTHVKPSSLLKSLSTSSISSMTSKSSDKIEAISPAPTSPTSPAPITPQLNTSVNSEYIENLLPTTNKERSTSSSSIILDTMDEKLRKKIEKQAVIHENDNESSSSSSDDDNDKQDNENKLNVNELPTKLKPDSPSSIDTQSHINTPSISMDTSPVHEKLLPQLEADILEQQKIMEAEQKKKHKSDNDPGIIGRFVKNIRNLTTTSTPLEDEEDPNIIDVIPIQHKKSHLKSIEEQTENKIDEIIDIKTENKKDKFSKTHTNKSLKGTVKMPPLRDTVQHVVLYETSHRFFLVGSNLECTKYWILKIDRKTTPSSTTNNSPNKKNYDRDIQNKNKNKNKKGKKNKRMTSPPYKHNEQTRRRTSSKGTRDANNMSDPSFSIHQHQENARRRPGLHIVEDRTVYNRDEINTILSMIRAGNRSNGGLTQCISGYGVVGFIRFLEGYYIVLITERLLVGQIGHHSVYKIEKTAMIPVTPSRLDSAVSKRLRSDETRYKNLFSVIDLTKEFYFSYSYDLSRTLQWNMCNHFRRKPNNMFVWNEFLLKPLHQATQSNNWMLPIIHGYYESKICSIYGREITLTLISRRSKQFAGTRYLKRGINDLGHSANDIETEQICGDRVGGDFEEGQFTSHVQMRASIPLFWVQDSNPMVPKPDIYIQKVDPAMMSIRKHFMSVFKRYGAPILAMNLIKHHESHARETIVGKEFKRAMAFINSFLPKDYKISYAAWDFKDCQRHKARSVVDELTKFAEWTLQRTGFFHSNPTIQALSCFGRRTHDIREDDRDIQPVPFEESDECKTNNNINNINNNNKPWQIPESVLLKAFCRSSENKRRIYDLGCFQKGIMRSNCIDSLDRTNVAQFIVGKSALGYQLYAMGIRDAPWLDRESDFIRVLLQMYERMGDCLALQYGGSQMHRQMKKDHAEARSMAPALYKQKDPGTRPREMFVSFVRHYQNNFQDNVKQDAMNLFLGTFRPDPSVGSYRLWELGSDYYLHNRLVTIYKKIPKTLSLQDQWWIPSVLSFNKTFIHCYKHIMLKKQIFPPRKTVRLMTSICKSIENAIYITNYTQVITNSYLGITNSYLPINNQKNNSNIDNICDRNKLFFELAFNPNSLTIFDEEMKLQCNKIETISRTPYYAQAVHALFYENPNENGSNTSQNQYEKSKISRITPFLRGSKKIKNKSSQKSMEEKDKNNNNNNNNNNEEIILSNQASMDINNMNIGDLDLTPYVANISTPSMHKLSTHSSNNQRGSRSPSRSPLLTSMNSLKSISYDEQFNHSLSASAPVNEDNNNNNNNTNVSVLYQDEDMHSQHLPSMTLSTIMQQSYKAYNRPPKIYKINRQPINNNNNNNNNEEINNLEKQPMNNNNNNDEKIIIESENIPKQLRHSRQDSILQILPIPMQFQAILNDNEEIKFDEINSIKNKKKNKKIKIEIDNNNNNDNDDEDEDVDRKRWKGFFNFFGGQWAGNNNNKEIISNNSNNNINLMEIGGGIGGQIDPNQQLSGFNRYGQPDIYYSDDIKQQNELALPKNIFMNKKDFTFFLTQNYGRYELSDYVLSTHECIEEKTEKDFIANVHRISIKNNNNNNKKNNNIITYPIINENNEIQKCIKSRFKETDIGLSQQDFSAFAKLHHSYLNLDQEIKFIENDTMKQRGYSYYSNLPQNICQQSLNPKGLNDSHINDDLLLPLN